MIKFTKTRNVKSPNRGTSLSAGIDFYIPDDWNNGLEYKMSPGKNILIPSGIKVKFPEEYALIAFNKSGIASKKGLIVGACVVDADYQGEIHINLINTNQPKSLVKRIIDKLLMRKTQDVIIKPGDKIVQFILVPVNYANMEEVNNENLYVSETERGTGGFGSTGNI